MPGSAANYGNPMGPPAPPPPPPGYMGPTNTTTVGTQPYTARSGFGHFGGTPPPPPTPPGYQGPTYTTQVTNQQYTPRSGAGHFGGPGLPVGNAAGPQDPGPLSGPGIGETYGQSHLGQYDQPTALETFANSQLAGNNPYYQRLQQMQADQINQQMAARGNYNSGGALAALGNASGALYANQFKDMGDLLGQSSSMQLGRENAGMNAAGGIQGLTQGRLGQQFANASDLAHLGAGTYGQFYGQGGQLSGDAAMAGINAGANAAQLAAQQQMAQSGFAQSMFGKLMGGMGK